MTFKHILVALELSDESHILIDRAVSLAKTLDAEVSFIHIDGTHGEIYSELYDILDPEQQAPIQQHSLERLHLFRKHIDYPLKQFLVGTGDLSDKIEVTIKEKDVDLLICGHHHDFWSQFISYSKNLVNKSPVDILIVPLEK